MAADRGRMMLQESLRAAIRDTAVRVLEDACGRTQVKAESSRIKALLAELKMRQLEDEERKLLTVISNVRQPKKDRRQAQAKADEVADLLAQWKKTLLKPGEQEEMDAKKREAEATVQEIEQLQEEVKMWQEKAIKKPKDAEPELERLAQEISELEAKRQQLEEEAKPKPRPPPKFLECDVVPILRKLMSKRVNSQDAEMVQKEVDNNFKEYCPPCRQSFSLEDLLSTVSNLDRYVDNVHCNRVRQAEGAMSPPMTMTLIGKKKFSGTVRHAMSPSGATTPRELAYRDACKLTLPEQPAPQSFLSRSLSAPGLRRF